MAKVDYEKLVLAYWENLTTVLRGFNPAEQFEFLETWVPDEDNAASILDIIKAAKVAGLSRISVHIGSETLRTIDISRLDEQAAKLGEVVIVMNGADMDLEVLFVEAKCSST